VNRSRSGGSYESTHEYGDSQTLYLEGSPSHQTDECSIWQVGITWVIYGSMILNSFDWPDCFIQSHKLPEQHTVSQGKSEDFLSWQGKD